MVAQLIRGGLGFEPGTLARGKLPSPWRRCSLQARETGSTLFLARMLLTVHPMSSVQPASVGAKGQGVTFATSTAESEVWSGCQL